MLHPPPNEVYSAFSFIGFTLSVIPFYWHLEAWNTGTCMFMFWTGLGCLVQFINSVVWNKNMIDRAPIYCDIVTRIQVALNVGVPASTLCINRRLYKIATVKAVMITRSERRRAIIQDLLICTCLPILQICAQYVVSPNRYNIYEDLGPMFATKLTPPTFFLLYSWPVAIGLVSAFYCSMTIYTFYKRNRQFKEMLSSSPGLSSSRYYRLMAISGVEICGTIPLATFYIVINAKSHVTSWKGWAEMHSHYYTVHQIAAFIWKNNSAAVAEFEMFRWSLVLCSFVFFALFGFADEARQHYRRVYTTLASRIGYSTFTLQGSSHATSSVPYVKSKGGVTVSVVTTGDTKENRRSSVSFADQPSTVPSISLDADFKTDLKVEEFSPSDSMNSTSVDSFIEPAIQDQLPALPAGTRPTLPPASFLPLHTHSGAEAV